MLQKIAALCAIISFCLTFVNYLIGVPLWIVFLLLGLTILAIIAFIWLKLAATSGVSSGPMAQLVCHTPLGQYYFRRYCKNLTAELSTFSFLGRSIPLDLEQIYIALRMTQHRRLDFRSDSHQAYQETQKEEPKLNLSRQDTMSIEAVLSRFPNVVILGGPGAGKTTLLKHLALRVAIRDETLTKVIPIPKHHFSPRVVPIFITLNDLARHDTSLIDGMVASLEKRGFPYSSFFLKRALNRGHCLCLFDGLDEVVDRETHNRLVEEIDKFVIKYSDNVVLVTSRTAGFTYLFQGNFTLLEITEFDQEEIRRFVQNWFYEEPKRGEGLLATLSDSPRIQLIAANPLLLSIIALVYELDVRLPERRVELYDRCLWVLTEEWERLKGITFTRQFSSSFVLETLETLALRLHTDRHATFDWSDDLFDDCPQIKPTQIAAFRNEVLQRTGLIRGVAFNSYAFTHLTIQEFLAAKALKRSDAQMDVIKNIDKPWWHESIVLLAGLERDATLLIKEILRASPDSLDALLLATRCLTDADKTEPKLRSDVVGRLVGWLKTTIDYDLVRGVRDLADALGDDAWAELTSLLSASDPEVQIRVAGLLGAIGSFRGEKPLIETVLHDEDPNVRFASATALREIDDRHKTDSFINVLHDPANPHRERAAVALGCIGDETACRVLCTVAADSSQSPEIRASAAKALGQVTVVVPAGEFTMGSNDRHNKDECPAQKVFLNAFRIDRYPVTNAQYESFLQQTGHSPPCHWDGASSPLGMEGHPVVNVTWDDANSFAIWCGKRLPTEAEWEKVARGTDARRWPWGDRFLPQRCNVYETKVGSTSSVGTFPDGDSPYGVSDMTGNAWEWTSDWYGPYQRPYQPASEGHSKIARGGCYQSVKDITHCTYRKWEHPDITSETTGFRCVLMDNPGQLMPYFSLG